MDLSEKELLAGAGCLDIEVLGAVYDRYQPKIFAYAMRLLGDECMAEDCVAETFLRFLKAMQAGKGPRDYLQAYLFRIAHNLITDIYRRQPPPPLELDERLQDHDLPHPDVQVERTILQEELRAALYRLTPDQRQVVMLRFFEGWNIEMVAEALQKPASAVKSLQHRALAALGRLLVREEEMEEEYVPGTRNRSAIAEVV
jgi:RNA polymerase sigma-70 factor (ECF subfamily)